MNFDKMSTRGSSIRIRTQPATSQLLSEKNKYQRYDSSLFSKTKFHLKPLKQNPELFTKMESLIGHKIKLNSNSTVNLSATKKSFLNGSSPHKSNKINNVFLPQPFNIRKQLMQISGAQKNLQKILQEDNKILVTAKKWVIFDMESNKSLKGYKQKKQHDIASLTKLMTFYTVYMIIQRYYLSIEKSELIADLQDEVITGTKFRIKSETLVNLEDMLYAMMLGSANNAATIIATNIGSLIIKKKSGKYFSCFDVPNESKEENMNIFIQLMNSYAQELDLKSTNFVNVHGIAKNISCARDVALITSECYKIPLFSKICNTKSRNITLKSINNNGELVYETQTIQNTNKLLWVQNSGCIGGKTGCNINGGESLAACYQGNIIIVVLGCATKQDKFADAQKLVNWLYTKLKD